MVIADPSSELLDLVRRLDTPATADAPVAEQRAAVLVRRRFGLSLPPPFAGVPAAGEPIRPAAAVDGPAIAAVKWRAFGTNYRGGVLPDRFLDERGVVPPASFWTGRAMVPPSRRHRLLVWGRPGTVFGYADCGPAHPEDLDPAAAEIEVGEVFELYVDPAAQRRGGGARLLEAAESWLREVDLSTMELSVLATNRVAQAFYAARGWASTGREVEVDLGVVRFVEQRWGRSSAGPHHRP